MSAPLGRLASALQSGVLGRQGARLQNGVVSEVWTHATWTVIPGRESEFVRAWGELGDWTVKAFPGAHGTLLRDTERPNVFVSFGPWPDWGRRRSLERFGRLSEPSRRHQANARAIRPATPRPRRDEKLTASLLPTSVRPSAKTASGRGDRCTSGRSMKAAVGREPSRPSSDTFVAPGITAVCAAARQRSDTLAPTRSDGARSLEVVENGYGVAPL